MLSINRSRSLIVKVMEVEPSTLTYFEGLDDIFATEVLHPCNFVSEFIFNDVNATRHWVLSTRT